MTLPKTVLVTGSSGFIGANLVKRLFDEMTEGTTSVWTASILTMTSHLKSIV